MIPFWWVDAFTDKLFGGNSAAVVYLKERELSGDCMQSLANEFQCSQTAFIRSINDKFSIRWFSPKNGGETPICGHATLASACALFESKVIRNDVVTFSSLAGPLSVYLEDPYLRMVFPSRSLRPWNVDQKIFGSSLLVKSSYQDDLIHVIELNTEHDVRSFSPDLQAIRQLPGRALCITARGNETDFVSRYFAPKVGIDEDPVCGSSYCRLAPFWAQKLQKTTLTATPLSQRGGTLTLKVLDHEVHYLSFAKILASGTLSSLPEEFFI